MGALSGFHTSIDRKYPKEILLPDGREVLIRPPGKADADGLLGLFQKLPLIERWRFDENPCERGIIEGWIDRHLEGRTFGILALYEDKVVGFGTILRPGYGGRRHTSTLQLALLPPFRKLGLCMWMTLDLIRRAMEFDIETLRADLVMGLENDVIEALGKCAFVERYVVEDGFRCPDGLCYITVVMTRTLYPNWSDF